MSSKIKPFSKVTEFHGHVCPGSAIGFKAAEIALKELSLNTKNELICITENDTCAVDAIQVLTGCTFGKGNLIFKDHGKQVYTFINNESEDAIRVSIKNSFNIDNINPELGKIRAKVRSNKASEDEKKKLADITNEVSDKIIKLPADEIFNVEHVKMEIPQKAMIFKSIKCDKCDEMVSMHKAKKIDDKYICTPCSKKNKKE